MPIYESDEHEFLNAKAKKIENNVYNIIFVLVYIHSWGSKSSPR